MSPLLLFPHAEIESAREVGEEPNGPGFAIAHCRTCKLFLIHWNVLGGGGCTSGNVDKNAEPQGGDPLFQHHLLSPLADLVEWANLNYKME